MARYEYSISTPTKIFDERGRTHKNSKLALQEGKLHLKSLLEGKNITSRHQVTLQIRQKLSPNSSRIVPNSIHGTVDSVLKRLESK